MLYLAYLDEFGHIGPFVRRDDPQHNTSPVFGLAGIVLPFDQVRGFATWFFQLKTNLLAFEIARDGIHPAKWEKKGSALFTTRNVTTYAQLRRATNRILNRVVAASGFVFYVGLKKTRAPVDHNPRALYRVVLMEAIRRLNDVFTVRRDQFLMVLDQQGDEIRSDIVAASGRTMFGTDGRRALIEPPIQAESHLYQTLQCADWVCGLIGRYGCYLTEPAQYQDLNWIDVYFTQRIRLARVHSSIGGQ